MYESGADRYRAKRDAGVSPVRSDGSLCSEETDREAAAAEQAACSMLGVPFNSAIYHTKGDGGRDCAMQVDVEVVWLGTGPDGEPRRNGNLILNPHEPWRFGHVYVVMAGSIAKGFSCSGWITHAELLKHGTRDFGYGKRLHCPVSELHQLRYLLPRKAVRRAS